jgi:hypothetical protein
MQYAVEQAPGASKHQKAFLAVKLRRHRPYLVLANRRRCAPSACLAAGAETIVRIIAIAARYIAQKSHRILQKIPRIISGGNSQGCTYYRWPTGADRAIAQIL